MRRDILLLVAGLAAVAALPLQEQAVSLPHSDLIKILSANPEENDLESAFEEELSVAPTKTEEQDTPTEGIEAPTEVTEEQDMPTEVLKEEKDTPTEGTEEQDMPTEGTEEQDMPTEGTEEQDMPTEGTEEQDMPTKGVEEQPQSQDSPEKQDPAADPHTSLLGGDYRSEEANVPPEPRPELAYEEEESLLYDYDEAEDEPTYLDQERVTLPDEAADRYVVFNVNGKPPSLDVQDTFVYEPDMTPDIFDQEGEVTMDGLERQPLPYDSDEETLHPQLDSLPFEPQEPQVRPFLVQPQTDSFQYDLEEPLEPRTPFSPDTHMDFFSLEEEHLELDDEHLPPGMVEGAFNSDYESDYESPVEAAQPDYEEDMFSVHDDYDDTLVEQPYQDSNGDAMADLFSWLVPDFFGDSKDHDESFYTTDYQDEVTVNDRLPNMPQTQPELQMADQTHYMKEPSSSEFFELDVPSDDSYMEGDEGVVVVGEAVLPRQVGPVEGAAGDVSLSDFFIPVHNNPTHGSIPQVYSEDDMPQDQNEEHVHYDEEDYSMDDGLLHGSSDLIEEEPGQVDTRAPDDDDILFLDDPSYEDERSVFPWYTDDDVVDQTGYLEQEAPVTILESHPTYVPDMETEETFPSLLEILEREDAAEEQADSWNRAKSFLNNPTSDFITEDEETLPIEDDYLLRDGDNDPMKVIVMETFDDFPITPLTARPIITRRRPTPTAQYPEDQHSRPYWVPQRVPDRAIPKIYFSISDDLPRRKIPVFLEHMTDGRSFSPLLSRRSPATLALREPFTSQNEIMDESQPPLFLESPRMSSRFGTLGSDTPSMPKNYPNAFRTPKISLLDLLQSLRPSFYEDTHISNRAQQSSPSYYPEARSSREYYNGRPRQLSHKSLPYSSPFDSFQDSDYSPFQNYYPNRPQSLSFYAPNNKPSHRFQDDPMPDTYSPPRPQTDYDDDYTLDLPVFFSNSFSGPHPRFPYIQRSQYPASSPSYKTSRYSPNNFYSTGLYHPTPTYPRYAPEYY